ncbi:hypothetical protein [Acanthamoeba polyphaga mimivirus]|uniref:Uncharacterized protein n=3 Tax=Megamimivirinae TaxID=3044648 RepID=A0A2L2DJA1_MIMIV|nr:hypothetical protein c7_R596 [Megavirus courdo7]AFX92566.1 hypothetical protein CE11_00540 [Megavirus courdo11]AVG46241.1 hypothetical protein [Acanthamoeba polyphaga mimivirus]AVL93835.1 hypothetical protein mvi_475 [Megavirus vitis]
MSKNNSNQFGITDPKALEILSTIKKIQQRMKDPDVISLEYIRIYDKLGREFEEFSDQYTDIFTKIIRGEKLDIIASVIYYMDKIYKGNMTEEELSDMLATRFLPAHLKADADAKMKEMKNSNINII